MSFFKQAALKLAEFFGEADASDNSCDENEFFLDQEYLADLLPYRLYDPEAKIYENKSGLGFVIEAIPLLGGSHDAILELNSLVKEIGEEGASIQCLLFADPRIGAFLEDWAEPRKRKRGVYAKIAAKKQDFFLQTDAASPRIFRCVFSFSMPKGKEKEIPHLLEKLKEKKKKAIAIFSRISHAIDLDPARFIDLLSGLIHLKEGPKVWKRDTFLSKQITKTSTPLEVKNERLTLSKTIDLRTYEAVDVPEQWSLAHMGELIGDFLNASYRIPTPFYLHYGIYFPSQSKAEARFRGKLKILEHQSKFPYLNRALPDLPRELEENLYVRRQLQEGEKFVETRLSCALYAPKERFAKAESTLLALFQKYGFKLNPNDFIHLPDFLSSLPMAWGEDASHISSLKRIRSVRTTLTQETANLMPCVGEWWGNSRKGMILMGRKGQIASFDPFATDGNLNSIVIGPSGSGKSVFMQEMILSHLGQGGRVFVLDLGRSFEKLCHLLDGQYLAFSEKSRLDLNPFHAIQDGDNASIEMVASIIQTMAMPMQKIDKERADILATLVKMAWEKEGARASIDTLIELIDTLKYSSELMIGAVESIKEGLKKYAKKGVYGNYFYGEKAADFSSDLVVIETEELKNLSDLQAVVLQIFTLEITNQIFMGDRSRRCLICIDEAWDLLKSPQMEGFIESLARRLRKYNGALVVGTQSIKDFERSAGAKAAFQNSNWLILLGKDNDSINAIKKENLVALSEFQEAALSSLRMEAGQYSELFLYHKGSGSGMTLQLRLDPFSAMLFSTKPEEFKAIEELKAQGMAMDEALEWLSLHLEAFKKRMAMGYSVQETISSLTQGTR